MGNRKFGDSSSRSLFPSFGMFYKEVEWYVTLIIHPCLTTMCGQGELIGNGLMYFWLFFGVFETLDKKLILT